VTSLAKLHVVRRFLLRQRKDEPVNGEDRYAAASESKISWRTQVEDSGGIVVFVLRLMRLATVLGLLGLYVFTFVRRYQEFSDIQLGNYGTRVSRQATPETVARRRQIIDGGLSLTYVSRSIS